MSPRELLFQRLHDVAEIYAFVGSPEDLLLECKVWPQKDDDAQEMLAKAFCGFANADGGVMVIGLDARAKGKDDPDLIQEAQPVPGSSGYPESMEITNLLTKLQGLRDRVRETGPHDLYLGLVEACAMCEALAGGLPSVEDMDALVARIEKRHLHVVHDSRKHEGPFQTERLAVLSLFIG